MGIHSINNSTLVQPPSIQFNSESKAIPPMSKVVNATSGILPTEVKNNAPHACFYCSEPVATTLVQAAKVTTSVAVSPMPAETKGVEIKAMAAPIKPPMQLPATVYRIISAL